MKGWSLLAAWLLVMALATTVTWQIVSAADDRVSDRPLTPLNVSAPPVTGADTSATSRVPTSAVAPASTSADPTHVTTTTTTLSTTSTSGASAVTTTTAAAEWQSRTVETRGGSVRLRYRPGEVSYQSATPAPGFKVDVDKPGPPEVEVEFESESEKLEVHAAWESGDLHVEVSGSVEGDD